MPAHHSLPSPCLCPRKRSCLQYPVFWNQYEYLKHSRHCMNMMIALPQDTFNLRMEYATEQSAVTITKSLPTNPNAESISLFACCFYVYLRVCSLLSQIPYLNYLRFNFYASAQHNILIFKNKLIIYCPSSPFISD